jgi:hypothetical protein
MVELGWVTEKLIRVFDGTISDHAESAFGRKQGGRRMFIKAAGANWMSDIKTPFQDHLGQGPDPGKQQGSQQHSAFDWLKQVAGNGGGTALIDPKFANVLRDHWQQANASPVQVWQQLAHELGGVFRIDSGNRFVMAAPGRAPSLEAGEATTSVVAKWGDNIISWRIQLDEARSTWAGSNQQFYDTAKALWNKVAGQGTGVGGGGGGVKALPAPAPNAAVADQQNAGAMQGNTPTTGVIVINGEPLAQWEGTILIIGARPGVDGLYNIKEVEHFYSRQGYISTLKIYRGGGDDTSSGDSTAPAADAPAAPAADAPAAPAAPAAPGSDIPI